MHSLINAVLERVLFAVPLQLQQQTFAQVVCSNARRMKRLNDLQHFKDLGFSRDAWQTLADGLRKLAEATEVAKVWNLRMDRSMFSTAALRRRAGRHPWCERFGLWTADSIDRDWCRRIRRGTGLVR
jgi:hypothetical protein